MEKNFDTLRGFIPEVEKEKEGLLRGGFISLSSSNVSALQNINCPQNGGACSADGNVNTTNVNCPFEGGKCSGSADTSHDVVNLNCTQNGGSCTGTVAPTTSEDTTSMSAKNLLGLSMLV